MQVLLDFGADGNTVGGEYGNALLATSKGGHVDVVKVLAAEVAFLKALQVTSDGRPPKRGKPISTCSHSGQISLNFV